MGLHRPADQPHRACKGRNVVERCFAKLKQRRAVTTCYDKLAGRYLAGVTIASLLLWLRHTASHTPHGMNREKSAT
ncbi:transposase [Streptosporangium pseudovulgare]|uniref:Transposase DDE domain-containing protein n=1 Tax=Streptosporangium pseudovulgare TaxID=35765 RepID=A0ABQ2RBQ1_9ACTN|nr:hypothetical protein GCM10010140_61660 [Streptosporangium pseudovulgare]